MTAPTTPPTSRQRRPLCRDPQYDPEMWFSDDETTLNTARGICGRCRVATACLTRALDTREQYGIFGGLDEKERAILHTKLHGPPQPNTLSRPTGTGAVARLGAETVFAAAREFMGGTTARIVAARHGFGVDVLTQAANVLRHTPELEQRVVRGEIALTRAAKHAAVIARQKKRAA